MGHRTNNTIALIAAGLFIMLGACEQVEAQETKAASFTRDLTPALAHRTTHLVDLDTFLQLSREANTVILDTRTPEEFARWHLFGAVNLPLSDMTLLKLADAVADRETRILIYGDENIREIAGREDFDVSTLPINLLTYISLHRYGYYDIYELGEIASRSDTRLDWVQTQQTLASLTEANFN